MSGDPKRVPVQGCWQGRPGGERIPAGTITWEEHCQAWKGYYERWHSNQTAERIAQRGGFSFDELVEYLGREPETWEAR